MNLTKLAGLAIAAAALGTSPALAQQGAAPAAPAGTWPAPQYVSIPMEITVNKPAAEVWAKIGGYCDISKWISPAGNVPCEITSGKGEVGTVRKIEGRTITLVLRSENAVVPPEVLTALPPTTEPNPRTKRP